MSIASATKRRRRAEDELEPIQRSHSPLLQELSREETQELARWLRARRGCARDLVRECESSGTILVQVNPVKRPETPSTARAILNRVNEVAFGASSKLNAEWDFLRPAARRGVARGGRVPRRARRQPRPALHARLGQFTGGGLTPGTWAC
jgi:hypothetical protein